jgi:hypothetical protein
MSDADIKANIGVSTDVEQATRRTQSGIVSMSKQIEDISKKFSTAGKDIFLGFFAPMAIFQSVLGLIQDSIAKAKQDAKDGIELLAKGETVYATSEEKKMANFFKAKRAVEEEQQLVEKGKQEMTARFLRETDLGQKMLADYELELARATGSQAIVSAGQAAQLKVFQDAALKAFLESPEGKAYQPMFDNKKDFKSPEGFSNVVGVGANPVLEAISAQLEESQKQTALLEQINAKTPDKGEDFTKPSK